MIAMVARGWQHRAMRYELSQRLLRLALRILGSIVAPSTAFMASRDSKITGCGLAPLSSRLEPSYGLFEKASAHFFNRSRGFA